MKRSRDIIRLWNRADGKCCYCGRTTLLYAGEDHPRAATREHILPRSVGGSDEKGNIALACYRCNQARGNKVNHLPVSARQAEQPKE